MNIRKAWKMFWDSAVKEAGSSFVKGCVALVPMIVLGLFLTGKSSEVPKRSTTQTGHFVVERYNPGYIETDTYNPGKLASVRPKISVDVAAPDGGYDVAAPDYGVTNKSPKSPRNYSPYPKSYSDYP